MSLRNSTGRTAGRERVDTVLDTLQQTDEELAAEAAREGSDGPAFVALVERFRQRVWRICYRLLGNEADASDAAQEVFVRLFLHRAKFDGRSKYATWAHSIAVRTCLSIRRGRGRRQKHETTASDQQLESTGSTDSHSEQPSGDRLSMDALTVLEDLDEVDRALLILKYAESYSYEELAAMFDLSVSACKMRVSRARDKVQERHGPSMQ